MKRTLAAVLGILLASVPQARAKGGKTAPLSGTTLLGRTGLLVTETAPVAPLGKGSVTGHLVFGDGDDYTRIWVPVGMNYGVSKALELSAGIEYVSLDVELPPQARGVADDTRSGLGLLRVGGKYLFPRARRNWPDLAAGAYISHGPLSDDLGDSATDVNLKGMATRLLPEGVLLNGGVGILIEGDRGAAEGETVIQLNGGAGYAFSPSVTGVVELAINEFGDDDGLFSFGFRSRTSGGLTFQGFLGFGVGSDAADLNLGAGVQYRFG